MIDYDPEKYRGDNFNGLQHSTRARLHGKFKVLILLYYKTHRVQKGGALFSKPSAEVKTLAGLKSSARLFLLLRLFPRSGKSTTSSQCRSALRIGLPRQLTRPGQSPGQRCADEPAELNSGLHSEGSGSSDFPHCNPAGTWSDPCRFQ